jgi:hypothetical protein
MGVTSGLPTLQAQFTTKPASAPLRCNLKGVVHGTLNQGIFMSEFICKEEMFPLLLEADPSFEPIWRRFLQEWESEENELPLTLAIDEFSKHLVSKLEAGETSRFAEVFSVIERLHFSTDSYVNNEVRGISEGILDKGCYTTLHPYDFELWLGTETKRTWLISNKGYYGREWPTDR